MSSRTASLDPRCPLLQNAPSGSYYNSTANKYGYNKNNGYNKYKQYSANGYRNNYGNYDKNNGENEDEDDDQYHEGYYNADNDVNGGYFMCSDDAGYYNVNQCMKLRTHAQLEAASWKDMGMATQQGGILQINLGGTTFGSERLSKEEDEYYETVNRAQVQQRRQEEVAERKAQVATLNRAKINKVNGFMFMLFGFVTLATVSLWAMSGAKEATLKSMKEPLVRVVKTRVPVKVRKHIPGLRSETSEVI